MSTLTQNNHNLTRWTLTSEDIFRTLSQLNESNTWPDIPYAPDPYEDITGADDIIALIEEADAVHALEFFGITVEYSYPTPNYNPHRTPPSLAILSIPNNFDPIVASRVVSRYLDIVEYDTSPIPSPTPTPETTPQSLLDDPDFNQVINLQAHQYNVHTYPHRGADDGTFDYAGSYPLTIFDFIHLTRTTRTTPHTT